MESETDNEVNTLDDLIGGQEVDVGTDVPPIVGRALKMPRVLRLIRLRKEVRVESGKRNVF